MKTAQEIFDETAEHMAKQGPAIADGTCVYRTPDGKKCALGYWLPDSEYRPEMEVNHPNNNYSAFQVAKLANPEHWDLLVDLQKVHDGAWGGATDRFNTHRMRAGLARCAERHNLDPTKALALFA